MSKSIVYKCNNCGKTVCDKEPKWLEIGSKSENELYIKNEISDSGTTVLNNYDAVHFCSKVCFIAFFFGREDAEMFHSAKLSA